MGAGGCASGRMCRWHRALDFFPQRVALKLPQKPGGQATSTIIFRISCQKIPIRINNPFA